MQTRYKICQLFLLLFVFQLSLCAHKKYIIYIDIKASKECEKEKKALLGKIESILLFGSKYRCFFRKPDTKSKVIKLLRKYKYNPFRKNVLSRKLRKAFYRQNIHYALIGFLKKKGKKLSFKCCFLSIIRKNHYTYEKVETLYYTKWQLRVYLEANLAIAALQRSKEPHRRVKALNDLYFKTAYHFSYIPKALKDKSKWVRIEALKVLQSYRENKQLSQKAFLAIADAILDPQIIKMALKLIKSVMYKDFIENITNQKILEKIAVAKELSSYTRAKAVKHLKSQKLLQSIILKEPEDSVREIAARKLRSSQKNLKSIALKDPSEKVRVVIIPKIRSQKTLYTIAKNDSSEKVRHCAVKFLKHKDELNSIARQDKSPIVRKEAAKRLHTLLQQDFTPSFPFLVYILCSLVGLVIGWQTYLLWKKKKVFWLPNILVVFLFCLLHSQIFHQFGPRHYTFSYIPVWYDWITFTFTHILKAVDIVDVIEGYGITIQHIRNNSVLSGVTLIIMHWVIDIFLLVWITTKLKIKKMKKISKMIYEIRFAVAGWLMVGVFVAMIFQGGIFLWILDNLIRAIDIGDTFQIFQIGLVPKSSHFIFTTIAVLFRFSIGFYLVGLLSMILMAMFGMEEEIKERQEAIMDALEGFDSVRHVIKR